MTTDESNLKTKTQLRAMRLKPTPGQRPSGRYWQGHTWIDLYDPELATPMRPYRPPTAAQRNALAAGRQLQGTAPCRICGQRFYHEELTGGRCDACLDAERWRDVAAEASAWLAQDVVFLDCESTGLDHTDQVVELSILGADGGLLFTSLVRPTCPMSPGAAAVHRIPAADLASAPAWPDVYEDIRAVLEGRAVVAFNATFDRDLIHQTCVAHGLPQLAVARWLCPMRLLTPLNGGRWPTLQLALWMAGAKPGAGDAHRAPADAESARQLVLAIVAKASPPNSGRSP